MRRPRLVSALVAAASVTGAAAVWWTVFCSRCTDAGTQYEDPWRLEVDGIVKRTEVKKVCFNAPLSAFKLYEQHRACVITCSMDNKK